MATLQDQSEDVFLASVSAQQPEVIVRLLRDAEIDFGCRPAPKRSPDGIYEVNLYATEKKLSEMRAKLGLVVKIEHNASAEGRERQQEVGIGDRFEGGKIAPHGFGRKNQASSPD